jgi:Ca-activated chloride channel family protein
MKEIFDRHQDRMTDAEERRVREAMFTALDKRRPAWRRWAVPGAALAVASAGVFAIVITMRGPADSVITDRFARELAPGGEIAATPSTEPALDTNREGTMGAVDVPESNAHPGDQSVVTDRDGNAHPGEQLAADGLRQETAAGARGNERKDETGIGLSAEAKAEARRRAMEPQPVKVAIEELPTPEPRRIDREELGNLPVDTFSESVALKSGVVGPDGQVHERSGRSGETREQLESTPSVSDQTARVEATKEVIRRSDSGSVTKPLPPRGQPLEVLRDKKADQERWPNSVGGTDPVNGQAYDAMFFQHYGVNPFVDPQEDRFATFSMDVDNASYAVTRSYLERGDLPPAEAVRVEEFVNAIGHNYAPPGHEFVADRKWAPSDHGTFAIHLEAAPSPFGDGLVLLRVGLKGREIDARARKPVVLTFVIDSSGSMEREDRLELVKRSLGMLLDQLDRDDKVGIVTYGTTASVVLPTTSVRYRRDIEDAIVRLQPGGSTNAEDGLRQGYAMAARAFDRDAVNRVILCSDGVANTGATGADDILAVIEREAGRGIEMTAIGVGMGNFNDALLEQLADKGDGNYFYVDDPAEARRVFVENLTGTLQTIARDAKIQVEFDSDNVRRYRLLGYENRDVADRDFRNDAVDAGEVGAGHEVTALFEAKLERDASGDLATVRIRYQDAESGRVVEESRTIRVKDIVRRIEQADASFRMDAAAAEFAEILRHSYWAKDGDLGQVLGLARSAARSMGSPSDAEELAGLVERADDLWNRNRPAPWGDDFRPRWEPEEDYPQQKR